MKVVTTEMDKGGKIQNKFQKCRTNRFLYVKCEMKGEMKGDAKTFYLSN